MPRHPEVPKDTGLFGISTALGADTEDTALAAIADEVKKLVTVRAIARRTMRIVRENIVFALAVKAAVLVLSALGLTGLWLAVFADVGVCVLAILNALRALQKGKV